MNKRYQQLRQTANKHPGSPYLCLKRLSRIVQKLRRLFAVFLRLLRQFEHLCAQLHMLVSCNYIPVVRLLSCKTLLAVDSTRTSEYHLPVVRSSRAQPPQRVLQPRPAARHSLEESAHYFAQIHAPVNLYPLGRKQASSNKIVPKILLPVSKSYPPLCQCLPAAEGLQDGARVHVSWPPARPSLLQFGL